MDTTRITASLKNLNRLSEAHEADVKWFSSSLLAIWPRPELSPEAKLFLTDDIAALYLQFGKDVLQRAIDDMRQTSERRPPIPQIKGRCVEIRGTKTNPLSEEMQQYFRDLRSHPEEFVPVALIVRDVMTRIHSKRKWSREEIAAQSEITANEWAEVVRSGAHEKFSAKFSLAVIERGRAAGQ